ncbi:MAG: GNAT family N-acetyltransferase [Hyphomicrobiaceae bacterium]
MTIRHEMEADHAAVRELLLSAFPLPSEADAVERLRTDKDVALALVALIGDKLVGHLMLSPMRAPFPALGLAPVSVHPDHRNQGIGRRLVAEAVDLMRQGSWRAIFVVGDPAYYTRFGFDAELAAGFNSPYRGPYLMVMAMREEGLPRKTGKVAFARAFSVFE